MQRNSAAAASPSSQGNAFPQHGHRRPSSLPDVLVSAGFHAEKRDRRGRVTIHLTDAQNQSGSSGVDRQWTHSDDNAHRIPSSNCPITRILRQKDDTSNLEVISCIEHFLAPFFPLSYLNILSNYFFWYYYYYYTKNNLKENGIKGTFGGIFCGRVRRGVRSVSGAVLFQYEA